MGREGRPDRMALHLSLLLFAICGNCQASYVLPMGVLTCKLLFALLLLLEIHDTCIIVPPQQLPREHQLKSPIPSERIRCLVLLSMLKQ